MKSMKISNKLKKRSFSLFSILMCALLAFMCVFPLVWMLVSSFKLDREVWAYPVKFLPNRWLLNNYRTLLSSKRVDFLGSACNTFFVAFTHTALALLIETMAAYAYARLEFRFKKLFWRITLFTMFIPGISIQLTSFVVVKDLGMLDSLWVLIIPSLGAAGTIFFYRQFFLNIPMSMEEAALVDGASRLRIYWSVFLPNALAPMVLMGTGAFIGSWNDYIWPSLTISSTDKYVIMQVIRTFRSQYGEAYGVVMAASVLSSIVPIVVFMIFQKHIVKGMLISGIK